jgi:hypothetical protein
MKVDAVSTLGGAPAQAAPPQFTDKEKRDELASEVNRRKVDYPGQVRQGRMRQEQADRHKAIMHAIWQDYVAKVASPQPTNEMAHAGDGDGAKAEHVRTIGVDHGAGDDMTSHHVIAGGGDGEIGRPVRPTIDQRIESDPDMQPKYDTKAADAPTSDAATSDAPAAAASGD